MSQFSTGKEVIKQGHYLRYDTQKTFVVIEINPLINHQYYYYCYSK